MTDILKITYVSTYGVNCGIATYTENLVRGLSRDENIRAEILAPIDDLVEIHKYPQARFCWTKGSPNLIEAVEKGTAHRNIVHFQHEYGIFVNNEMLFAAIKAAKKNGAVTVITLHTVFPFGEWDTVAFVRNLLAIVDYVIVHSEVAHAAIVCAGTANKVLCIPHGTPVGSTGDKKRGYDLLGIPEEKRNLIFGGSVGFIGPNKAIDRTLLAYVTALSQGYINDAKHGYIICGAADEKDTYLRYLRDIVFRSCSRSIFIKQGFIPRENMADIFAVLDYGVLNTISCTLSASGQAHEYLAHGVPLAASLRQIYTDAIRAGALAYNTPADGISPELINAIGALANSEALRECIKLNQRVYAKRTNWNRVAESYIALYRQIAR